MGEAKALLLGLITPEVNICFTWFQSPSSGLVNNDRDALWLAELPVPMESDDLLNVVGLTELVQQIDAQTEPTAAELKVVFQLYIPAE